MYKTVRKGDASLQYTILPQTDQMALTPTTPVPKKKTSVTKYVTALVVILVILALTAATLINQTKIGGTILGIPRETLTRLVSSTNVTKVHKNRHKTPSPLSASKFDPISSRMIQRIAPTTPLLVEDEPKTTNAITESTSALKNILRMTTSSSLEESSESATSSTLKSILPTTLLTSTVQPKKSKMPRVTLKLRENETVPQMYMKAGIASYKKGNITTSVLAHGLSLEGLIFKTPEGTIKPWAPCIPGTRSYLNWTHSSQVSKVVHLVLTLLAALTVLSLVGLYYVQRKTLKRHRQSIEEAEADLVDNSTLLNNENEEAEEKE